VAAASGDGGAEGDPATRPAPEQERGGSETILVVEDEPALRDFLELILSEVGYRVVTARDGEEALELTTQSDHSVQLVLTDSIMPRLSGPELVRRLADTRPDVRVLQISGYTDHGFDGYDFVAKPFEPETLLRRVREVLDRP
jgi:two-component system, cell cycle sensor histidine kinase and response regulator CckA